MTLDIEQFVANCAAVVADTLLNGSAKGFGVEIAALLGFRFLHFDRAAVRVGLGIVTDTRHLPGNLRSGLAASDLETIPGYFFCNVEIGAGRSDGGQLIAEILVQRFKIAGELDRGASVGIQHDDAVVNVLHVRRFNRSVEQILLGGLQRVVDLETLGRADNGARGHEISRAAGSYVLCASTVFGIEHVMRSCTANSSYKDKAATATAGNCGFWLPPRDSNPDTLLQRQMSYR